MKLTNPTNDQLDAAFATEVAGWRLGDGHKNEYPGYWYSVEGCVEKLGKEPMKWTASFDAVLPWLQKRSPWRIDSGGEHGFMVQVWNEERIPGERFAKAQGNELAQTAVVALLRAHGVEVEFTK